MARRSCRARRTRPWLALLLGALVTILPACGGGGGGGGPDAMCAASNPVPAQDKITFGCGAILGQTVVVQVNIGGQTQATDIAEVLFDVFFNQGSFTFRDSSAADGDLLTQGGVNTITTAALAQGQTNRVIAATARQAMVPGVQAAAGTTLVMSMAFDATGLSGTDTLSFQNAEVKNSAGTTIGTLSFEGTLDLTLP